MPVGSRVEDAVEAAGGATREADLARVNLARVVVDGEQVACRHPATLTLRSVRCRVVRPPLGRGPAATRRPLGRCPSTRPTSPGSTRCPGVGPVLAQRIVDWRTQHGRFTSVEELGEVSGIGEKLLARLRPLVTL